MVDTTPLVETAGKKEEKIGHKICGKFGIFIIITFFGISLLRALFNP
jgi:hypothetical protein